MQSNRSERHQISSYHLNKVSSSPIDDKRYILNDGITSFAYGNKKNRKIIENYMNVDEVLRKGIGLIGEIDNFEFKRIENRYPETVKKRAIERSVKRAYNITRTKLLSNNVKYRLQKKLIERGKLPSINFNSLIKVNTVNNQRFKKKL